MIIVGDIHARKEEPFRSAIRNFFVWLQGLVKNETIVFLGDLHDSSSSPKEIETEIIELTRPFSRVIVCSGNHDYNKRIGNILQPLSTHNNITGVLKPEEIKIDNFKCLFLPFLYKKDVVEEYGKLVGEYDFIFTHITPKRLSFGNEGVSFNKNLKGIFIHGHTHIQTEFTEHNQQHIVIGVPLPTKHLEERQNHRIIRINEKKELENIDVPQYFTYETIKFGEQPKSRNNIINVVDCPDINSVYDMYKDFHVREDGIELKRNEINEESETLFQFDDKALKSKWEEFNINQGKTQEVLDCGLKYLEKSNV